MSRNKQSFLQGALILSLAAILTKVIGALLFKIPLQKINGTAYGYFEAAYGIYVPLYTVSTAGLPLAVSRMVSESLTLGRYRDVAVIHRVANRIFLTTGLIGTLLMIVAAFIYPQYIDMPNARLAMIIMAPSILFCCMVTGYRGVYEGSRNMVPTAVSQVVEAVGKLIFGLCLAAAALYWGQYRFSQGLSVFGRMAATAEQALEYSLPYIAGGGMAGVTVGSLLSLLYLMWRYRRRGSGLTAEQLQQAEAPYASRTTAKKLIAFAIPVALGTLATQLTNLIDVTSLQKCLAIVMERSGEAVRALYAEPIAISQTSDVLGFLTGNRGIAMTFVNLVPNITLTFGVSALPIVTSAWTAQDRPLLRKTVAMVLRMTLLIALPAGLGLAVLAKPIMLLIYGPAEAAVAGALLQVLGVAVIFICLTAPINAMLQAMGRADIPAKIVLVGGAVKLILNLVLVLDPRLNIQGSSYSTLACYVVMVVLSLIALRRVAGVQLDWRSIFVKPLTAAALCAVTAWGMDALLEQWISASVATVTAVASAVIVYIFSLLFLRVLTRE